MSEDSASAACWKLFESSGCIAFYLMYRNLLEEKEETVNSSNSWS